MENCRSSNPADLCIGGLSINSGFSPVCIIVLSGCVNCWYSRLRPQDEVLGRKNSTMVRGRSGGRSTKLKKLFNPTFLPVIFAPYSTTLAATRPRIGVPAHHQLTILPSLPV